MPYYLSLDLFVDSSATGFFLPFYLITFQLLAISSFPNRVS